MPGRSADDPLSLAMAPPPNETAEEAAIRIRAEEEAKRISDSIDEMLHAERVAERRSKPLRILLLGQSESGKSTTLKNFQLMYTPKAFKAERASWRSVIQLNLIRSIRTILEALAAADEGSITLDSDTPPLPPLTTEQRTLRMRLLPLLRVEDQLIRQLAGPGEIEATKRSFDPMDARKLSQREISVSAGWKDTIAKLLPGFHDKSNDVELDFDDPQDPGHVLQLCRDDIRSLWDDPQIKTILKAQKIRLEDQAGFFLNDLDRITEKRYMPSDDDVLRARLKTLGVTEYRFSMESGNAVNSDWRIYDVGGTRSQRLFWAPFFDYCDAIIFLAPISCFDQSLAEDRTVNRLEDSVLLWKDVCSNRLLQTVQIILFLNKIDLFRQKLESGVSFSKYVTTYGNRPNDVDSCSAYLKRKFASIQKETSPQTRQFFCHFTAVTDTKATSIILARVGDLVVRANLKDSNLI